MSTWLDDITDRKLRESYALLGNQPTWALRNMIKALQSMPWLNTADDTERLQAAQYIVRSSRQNRKG